MISEALAKPQNHPYVHTTTTTTIFFSQGRSIFSHHLEPLSRNEVAKDGGGGGHVYIGAS